MVSRVGFFWVVLSWKVMFCGCFQMKAELLSPPDCPARRSTVNATSWRWTREEKSDFREHPLPLPHTVTVEEASSNQILQGPGGRSLCVRLQCQQQRFGAVTTITLLEKGANCI